MWIPFKLDGATERVSSVLRRDQIKVKRLASAVRLNPVRHGTASGVATNVVSGRAMRHVKLVFRGARTRRVVYTRLDGRFKAPRLLKGKYTVTASKPGYVTNAEHFRVFAGRDSAKAVLLSPRLRTGEMRFVLTWGQFPRDLDSYLQTPNGCTVYYRRKRCRGARLDLDNVKGAGPETITLSKFHKSGFYYYYVRQYSRRGTVERSRATVRVFSGSGYTTYRLGGFGKLQGPHGRGRTWLVLKIDGKTRKVVDGKQIPVKVGKPRQAAGRRRRAVWARGRRLG
jgi:hypothetical protein